jgi:ketosteroid isomerase-like protein
MNDSTSLVRSVYTAFQRGDIQSILNVLSAGIDWKYYGPVPWAGERNGPEQVGAFFQIVGEALDIKTFEPSEYITERSNVVVFGRTDAIARKSGKPFENRWAHVLTVENGKIIRFVGHDTSPL